MSILVRPFGDVRACYDWESQREYIASAGSRREKLVARFVTIFRVYQLKKLIVYHCAKFLTRRRTLYVKTPARSRVIRKVRLIDTRPLAFLCGKLLLFLKTGSHLVLKTNGQPRRLPRKLLILLVHPARLERATP